MIKHFYFLYLAKFKGIQIKDYPDKPSKLPKICIKQQIHVEEGRVYKEHS